MSFFTFKIDLTDRFYDLLLRITKALENRNPKFLGGRVMFIVKATNEDVGYSIVKPTVTDAEGDPIPDASLTFEAVSDNPDVVALTASADDPLAGTVHFGAPGLANINVTVKSGDLLLGSFGAQFTITVGDPAAITGGGITFAGLTES
jgi:hypothetical protein